MRTTAPTSVPSAHTHQCYCPLEAVFCRIKVIVLKCHLSLLVQMGCCQLLSRRLSLSLTLSLLFIVLASCLVGWHSGKILPAWQKVPGASQGHTGGYDTCKVSPPP